jgi:long-subunit acyl-CoA synthetase (AMP-forming)
LHAVFDAVLGHARRRPDRIAVRDAAGALTRAGLLAEAGRLAARLPATARTLGFLMPNGREWAVAQLAAVAAGRVVVPLPTFFSPEQLAHVGRDAGIDLVLTTATAPAPDGVPSLPVTLTGEAGPPPDLRPGFGTVVYTSGSTGRPKGVRHASGQLAWSAAALAAAIAAGEDDSYLSVLPLPLLLETICALVLPALVGGSVTFDAALADAVGRGAPAGLAAAFARHRPTTGVLVPDLLRLWVAELAAAGRRAPDSLRFVAVGGAAVPPQVAEAAWRLGIPAHEGYGLTECCSVVAVNRPGRRVAGTVGEPLAGLSVTIVDGEIVVDGPSVTDGYLGAAPAPAPAPSRRSWATGDLGAFDAAGRLTVSGRRDALVVTALGRNVSPEWVEAALLDDPGIAAAAVAAAGAGLAALIVPTAAAAAGFASAGDAAIAARVAGLVAALPAYARPARVRVVAPAEARAAGLLTDNGRIRRRAAGTLLAEPVVLPSRPVAGPAERIDP